MTTITGDFFEARTNRIVDPGFEYGALRHDQRSAAASVTDSSAVVSTPTIRGARSLRVSCSANGNAGTSLDLVTIGWRTATIPATIWSAAAQTAFITTGFTGFLQVRFLDAAGSLVGSAGRSGSTTAARLTVLNRTAPALTAFVELACILNLTSAGAGALGSAYFDDLILLPEATIPAGVLDGDRGNAEWGLMPNLSAPSSLGEDAEFASMLDWVPPYWYSEPLVAM